MIHWPSVPARQVAGPPERPHQTTLEQDRSSVNSLQNLTLVVSSFAADFGGENSCCLPVGTLDFCHELTGPLRLASNTGGSSRHESAAGLVSSPAGILFVLRVSFLLLISGYRPKPTVSPWKAEPLSSSSFSLSPSFLLRSALGPHQAVLNA